MPSGAASATLTFLFADIRDHTAFVEAHGDARARQLIASFRKLVRAQLAVTGGGEVKTEGDSFYLVFHTAGQALRCGSRSCTRPPTRAAQVDRSLSVWVSTPVSQCHTRGSTWAPR